MSILNCRLCLYIGIYIYSIGFLIIGEKSGVVQKNIFQLNVLDRAGLEESQHYKVRWNVFKVSLLNVLILLHALLLYYG